MIARPTVSRIVHYVGSEHGLRVCRGAMVTAVLKGIVDSAGQINYPVSLCVFEPTGFFFPQAIQHDHRHAGGTWHWPEMLFDDQAQLLGQPAAAA